MNENTTLDELLDLEKKIFHQELKNMEGKLDGEWMTVNKLQYKWCDIENIKEEKNSDDVYDIELEKNHYFPANDIISHNCRLSLSLEDLRAHTGGLFGNADNTGSLQVVTVNLPYVTKEYLENGIDNIDLFFEEIKFIMDEIKKEQLWKREIIDEYFRKGYFELAKQNFRRGFDTFFTTIGFIGLWECVEMLINDERSFLTPEGMELAEKILYFMKDLCDSYITETGKLFNLESTPAEGATYKLAKKSLKRFPDIKHRGLKKAPYFTNSCHLPVEYQDNLDLIFETQNKLQIIPTGGSVTHFTTGEPMTDSELKEAIRTICHSKIPFFSINTVFSICPICSYVKGKHFTCPNKHTEEDLIKLKQTRPDYIIEK